MHDTQSARLLTSAFLGGAIAFAITTPANHSAYATGTQDAFRARSEVHLIVGACDRAGYLPLQVNGAAVTARYIRAADAHTAAGQLGGTTGNLLRQSDLPNHSARVADTYSVNITNIETGTPNGAGDTSWIMRGGNHPDRGYAGTLAAQLNPGPQSEFQPEFLAVSFCTARH